MCEVEKNVEIVMEEIRMVVKLDNNREMYEIERMVVGVGERGGRRAEEKLHRIEMALSWKYMGIPPKPYLPQPTQHTPLPTLILDLD